LAGRRINSNSLAFIRFLWRSLDREWKLSFSCSSFDFLDEIPVSVIRHCQVTLGVDTALMCSKRLFVATNLNRCANEVLRYEFKLEIYAAIVHFMIFYDLCA